MLQLQLYQSLSSIIIYLKPAYGEIFKEDIKIYDFWGFADLDIIWGSIESFIDDNKLNRFDILTSREKNIAGHFTLLRNTNKINKLYKKVPDYKTFFEKKSFNGLMSFILIIISKII